MAVTVQTEEVREAILDAAEQLMSERGYKKMTIDELAVRVGIGKGSVYLHFPSKEEIALSHIDRIVERLKTKLHEVVTSETGAPEERLKKMLVCRVLHRFDSVQHYTISISDLLAAIRPQLLARRERYFAEEAQIFARVIVEGQIGGVFQNGDALEIAETLLTATNSLLPLSLSTQELGERGEIEEKINRLADLLLSGILKRV
jgi:AcrR family transcriptional regulator